MYEGDDAVFRDTVRLLGWWQGCCAACKWKNWAARYSYASAREKYWSRQAVVEEFGEELESPRERLMIEGGSEVVVLTREMVINTSFHADSFRQWRPPPDYQSTANTQFPELPQIPNSYLYH